MPLTNAYILGLQPAALGQQSPLSYWAVWIFPGASAQPVAEAVMHGLASVLPAGGGTVVLVAAAEPTKVVASAPWGEQAQKSLESGGGGWWQDFVQRWAGTWWRR